METSKQIWRLSGGASDNSNVDREEHASEKIKRSVDCIKDVTIDGGCSEVAEGKHDTNSHISIKSTDEMTVDDCISGTTSDAKSSTNIQFVGGTQFARSCRQFIDLRRSQISLRSETETDDVLEGHEEESITMTSDITSSTVKNVKEYVKILNERSRSIKPHFGVVLLTDNYSTGSGDEDNIVIHELDDVGEMSMAETPGKEDGKATEEATDSEKSMQSNESFQSIAERIKMFENLKKNPEDMVLPSKTSPTVPKKAMQLFSNVRGQAESYISLCVDRNDCMDPTCNSEEELKGKMEHADDLDLPPKSSPSVPKKAMQLFSNVRGQAESYISISVDRNGCKDSTCNSEEELKATMSKTPSDAPFTPHSIQCTSNTATKTLDMAVILQEVEPKTASNNPILQTLEAPPAAIILLSPRASELTSHDSSSVVEQNVKSKPLCAISYHAVGSVTVKTTNEVDERTYSEYQIIDIDIGSESSSGDRRRPPLLRRFWMRVQSFASDVCYFVYDFLSVIFTILVT